MKFVIYQIKKNKIKEGYPNIKFNRFAKGVLNIEELSNFGYDVVYNNDWNIPTDEIEALEELFYVFNMEHPTDFKGHSLSVSDIVKINDKYYYCNSCGWKLLA